ncbi:MAG: SMP-30/gluconolactonase/LRE family protein [Verrucomicrobiota bacterium]
MRAESKIFPDHQRKAQEEMREGIEIFDTRFRALLKEGASLRHHWRGAEWSEGPVYLPNQDVVVWSDIPNNRMLQFCPNTGETTVFREPSDFSNGHYADLEGRLVSCQHLTHGITRTEHDGTIRMLVDRIGGKRLNSPNDLVVKSDGSIWFTDPPYGILSNREGEKRDSELEGNFVYRFHPETGEISAVITCMDRPNGLAFSPDEKILYVADTGAPRDVVQWEVCEDRKSVINKRPYIKLTPGATDGFRCDVEGNVWTSAGDGIQCFTPAGELIGKILVPEWKVANCCFGGKEFMTLYIAGDTSLYSIDLGIRGARPSDLITKVSKGNAD